MVTNKATDEIKINVSDLVEIGFESNIRATIVDGLLVLVIDVVKDLGPSSTGKMTTIASSYYWQQRFWLQSPPKSTFE